MNRINNSIHNVFNKVDRTFNNIPSKSLDKMKGLYQKYVKPLVISAKKIQDDHNYSLINQRNFIRSALLMIPVVGSIIVALNLGARYEIEKKDIENLDSWAKDSDVLGNKAEAVKIIKEAFEKRSTQLDLSKLGLTSLPSCIGNLKELEKLDLSDNKLYSIPKEIGGLSNLKELIVRSNILGSKASVNNPSGGIPKEIGKLGELRNLDLRKNGLSSIPNEIGKLSELRKLKLSGNKLDRIPTATGGLAKLNELDLSQNELDHISASICRLQELNTLKLEDNNLTGVSKKVADLKNLSNLYLTGNKNLKSLPDTLKQLRLRIIETEGTKIKPENLESIMVACEKNNKDWKKDLRDKTS